MKQYLPDIAIVVAAVAVLISIGYSWTYRLYNPDLSDTRVFLNTWKINVPLLTIALACIVYIRLKENRDE